MSDQGKVFIIAGMHRSSTSLASSIVNNGGVHVGRTLLAGDYANAHGYFENEEFTKFHRAVLREQRLPQAGWVTSGDAIVSPAREAQARRLLAKSAKQAGANNWGWKDPRTTLFLEFWRGLIPTASFIFLYRSPWEVMDSIFRRAMEQDMFFQGDPRLLLDIWSHYNRKVLEFMERHPNQSLLVSSNAIVADPAGFIARINERFGTSLTPPATGVVDAGLINRGVSDTDRPRLVARVSPEAIAILDQLNRKSAMQDYLCALPAPEPAKPEVENRAESRRQFRKWFDDLNASRLSVNVEVEPGNSALEVEQAQAIISCQWAMMAAMENVIRRFLRSNSWSMTAAFRMLEWRVHNKVYDRTYMVEIPPGGAGVKARGTKRVAFILPGVFLPGTYQIRIKVAAEAVKSPIELQFKWASGAKNPSVVCPIQPDGTGSCSITLKEPIPICNILTDPKLEPQSLLEFEMKRSA